MAGPFSLVQGLAITAAAGSDKYDRTQRCNVLRASQYIAPRRSMLEKDWPMTTPSASKNAADPLGIGFAGLCLAHCLLLPSFAAVLPVIGVAAEAEWLHKLLAFSAVPVSLWAMFQRRNDAFVVPFAGVLAIGLGLLLAPVLSEALEDFEVPLTVAGGVILVSAHFTSWRLHRKK